MGSLLAEVLPLALGAAISPLLFFGGVAVMTGPSPLRRGSVFALGAALPLLAATGLVLAFGSAVSLPDASDRTKAIIDLAFGLILIALGLRTLRRRGGDAESEKHHGAVASGSAGRLLATGAGLMVSNVTTLALYLPAMKLVAASGADAAAKVAVIAIAIAITLALVLVPLAIVAVAPHASERVLTGAGAWLTAHRRTLSLVVCFGLGAYLVARGLTGM